MRRLFALQVCPTAAALENFVVLFSHINLYKREWFRLCGGIMDLAPRRFNSYFLALALALAGGVGFGCKTTSGKAPQTTLRVHAQATDNSGFTRRIKVFRAFPADMVVEQSHLLTEAEVKDAAVVETLGGFALQIKLGSRGQWLLDHHSSLHLGRRLAIFATFGPDGKQARWLAAPILSRRISDGVLLFTPDATREEAELIVAGLQPKDERTVRQAPEETWP